ncbi:MAG: biotin synthase BioB, partial [Planctomycetota bacterium]|nr:biotin synthase BioB [Planctomycetota bacterium]
MSRWNSIAERSIEGSPPTREEALEVLRCPKGELLDLLQAAYRVRSHHHGKTVKLHILLNAMSGMCPEDCTFCSQSIVSKGEIERYRLMSKEEIVSAAKNAKENKAWKFCIVTSTRGPNDKQLDVI